MITRNLVLRLFVATFLVGLPAVGHSADLCAPLFASREDLSTPKQDGTSAASDPARRERAVSGQAAAHSQREWLKRLQASGRLIYEGKHDFVNGTEFLASNEGDWHKTPFDWKPTEVLIAFGTNSSWEIAANKLAKTLVLADWSPLPLFAHAYLIEPLMRISTTPQQLLMHLAGIDPTNAPPIDATSLATFLAGRFELPTAQIKRFLDYLSAHKEITDEELEFMSEYYRSRDSRGGLLRLLGKGAGPFRGLRDPEFANFNLFLELRYAETPTGMLSLSVLHNQKHFDHVRELYVNHHVEYALAGVKDMGLYENVQRRHANAQSWTLSVTNIFDMNYNDLTFPAFQNLLAGVVTTAGISNSKSLTVFRTTNYAPPHGFYRYDIKTAGDIPQTDERDSKAHLEAPRASGW
jgi:hypothetical protein